MSDLSEHIGKRIKLYRQNKRLTQSQFANQIHKSKSAVSKYECGQISIDIDTLYDIADVLDISIFQLLDYHREKPRLMPEIQGFFRAPARLYTYYLNKNSTRIVRGVLEINQTDEYTFTTTFFADCKDYENLYHCNHLYFGDIHYSDSYVNIVMKNQANEAERIFMMIANPLHYNASLTVGIVTGISGKYLVPISLKIVFSQHPLTEDEDLRNSLRFTKEDFRRMKQTYCFSIERYAE